MARFLVRSCCAFKADAPRINHRTAVVVVNWVSLASPSSLPRGRRADFVPRSVAWRQAQSLIKDWQLKTVAEVDRTGPEAKLQSFSEAAPLAACPGTWRRQGLMQPFILQTFRL